MSVGCEGEMVRRGYGAGELDGVLDTSECAIQGVDRIQPLHRVIELRPFCNGKFGRADYTNHPQLFFTQYPWVPCVARRPANEERFLQHRLYPLWDDGYLRDWEVLPVHAFHARGVMRQARWEDLARTVRHIDALAEPLALLQPPPTFATTRTAMLASLQRLRHLLMTKRDFVLQIGQCQRMALDVDAMCTFLQRFHARDTTIRAAVDEDLMGCFTTNPAVADKMYHRGIPVWLVRDATEVPPGTVKVVRIAPRSSQSPGIYELDYSDCAFEPVALVRHELQRITLLRTMGRQFTDLVRLPAGPAEVITADQQDLTVPPHFYDTASHLVPPTPAQYPSSAPTPMPPRTPSPLSFSCPTPALAAMSLAEDSFSAPTPIFRRSPSPLSHRATSSVPAHTARQLPRGIVKKKAKVKRAQGTSTFPSTN